MSPPPTHTHIHARPPSRHCSCTQALLTTQRQTRPAGEAKGRSLGNGHSQNGLIWEARRWRREREAGQIRFLGLWGQRHLFPRWSDHSLLSPRPLAFSFHPHPLPSLAHQQRLEKKKGCLPCSGLPSFPSPGLPSQKVRGRPGPGVGALCFQTAGGLVWRCPSQSDPSRSGEAARLGPACREPGPG